MINYQNKTDSQFFIQQKIRLGVFFFSLVIGILTFYFVGESDKEGFRLLWLLPLSYGFLYYFSNMWKSTFKYSGITILNTILILRYIITPFYSSYFGLYYMSSAKITQNSDNDLAIVLMLYEMLCIFIAMHLGINKLNFNKNKYVGLNVSTAKHNIIYILVLIIGLFSLIVFPKLVESANFITYASDSFPNLNTFETIGFFFVQSSIKVIFVLVVIKEFKKKQLGKKVKYMRLVLFAFLQTAIFWGGSRVTVLMNGLFAVLLLNYLKLSNKFVAISIVGVSIFSIVTITALENYNSKEISVFTNETSNSLKSEQFIIDNLQAYSGGHHLIAITASIKNSPLNKASIYTFLNEFLSSIVFVRQIFPPSPDQTTVLFNKEFGFFEGNSMILPTLGQSYLYFSILGAPIISILLCFLLIYTELAFIKSTSIGVKYSFLLLLTFLPFFPMQNINIVTNTIFNVFLPFYLINYYNSRF